MMLNTTAVNEGQPRQSGVADDITSAVKTNYFYILCRKRVVLAHEKV